MVFSSPLFVFLFLPTALAVYYAAPRRARHLVLTLVSYVFYGWTNPAFALLLLLSTTIDYLAGLALVGTTPWARGEIRELPEGEARTRRQKIALAVSLTSNLSLLGFFKYFEFAVDSWNGAAAALGLSGAAIETALRVTLPLGISFYTFQSMSYAIDVYRGEARALRNFVDFACFVSMFPQLVAGPIIRFSEVDDQLRSREHSATLFARGVAFFAVGLAKKVLLANPCGRIADTLFAAGCGLGHCSRAETRPSSHSAQPHTQEGHAEAARGPDGLPGDEQGPVRRQERHQARHILRPRQPPHGRHVRADRSCRPACRRLHRHRHGGRNDEHRHFL